MNAAFCKTELAKVFGNESTNTFVKYYAYIPLKDGLVAKATMHTSSLDVSIISCNAGTIDDMRFVYGEIFAPRTGEGYHGTRVMPAEIKADENHPEWKCGTPSDEDYAALRKAVTDYLNIFRML